MNIHLECNKCFYEDTVEFDKVWHAPEKCPSCGDKESYNVTSITSPKEFFDILMDMRRHIK